MINKIKKIIILAFCMSLLLPATGCGDSDTFFPGSGTPGEIADVEWEKFDALLDASAKETDFEKRALILHQAEEYLMDSGLVIPLLGAQKIYVQKPYISGVEVHGKVINIEKIKSERPEDAGSISIQCCTETEKLDPAGNSTADCTWLTENTYSRLLKYNAEGEIVPDLCESYSVSDDGCTYTFYLRDNLKWSDGSEFSAMDFEYSWKRAAKSENGMEYGGLFDIIKGYPDNLGVTSSDDGKILTVELNNPCAYFTDICCYSASSPVKKQQVESADGYKNAEGKVINPSAWAIDGPIISNGPFTVDTWKHNEYMVLKKNPYYYDSDNVVTDTVNVMLVKDPSVAYSAYMSDSVCLTSSIPTDIVDTVFDTPECGHIIEPRTTSMMFCSKSPIFEGMTRDEAATFRKAIGFALDRQFMVDVALSKTNYPALTYIPKNMNTGTGKSFGESGDYTYPLDGGYYPVSPDLDKAREMLSGIGFEFGDDGKLKNPITIEYMFPSNISNEAVAVCIQADLARLGIHIIPSTREFVTFLGERTSQIYDSCRDAWSADYNDPYGMVYFYKTGDANNSLQIE